MAYSKAGKKMKQIAVAAAVLLLFTGCKSTDAKQAATSAETVASVEVTGETETENMADADATQVQEDADADQNTTPAPDFTLTDQYGNTHTLSDYKGSVVFINFWATWCPPCRAEMPDIQKLYEEYKEAGDDSVVILGVAAPGLRSEKDRDGIVSFLNENGYTYPVLMDETGEQFLNYYVFSYPTTFMIDRDGNVFGYVSGSLPEETMREIIRKTLAGEK